MKKVKRQTTDSSLLHPSPTDLTTATIGRVTHHGVLVSRPGNTSETFYFTPRDKLAHERSVEDVGQLPFVVNNFDISSRKLLRPYFHPTYLKITK